MAMRKPPEKPSDEADRHQIAMAKREGAAYHASLKYMAYEVADNGGQKQAGDYIVAFAQERAEGMYMLESEGALVWDEPTDQNCHLEISVSDAGDQRFIPYLHIMATLTPKTGKPVGPFEVPFVWHPGLYHYGRNVKVPGDGTYRLDLVIKPPTFMRHDKVNGVRYSKTVEVTFESIKIKTGKE
jgi:Fe2+ transport protein